MSDFLDWLKSDPMEPATLKHQQGKHNQDAHGNRGGKKGGGSDSGGDGESKVTNPTAREGSVEYNKQFRKAKNTDIVRAPHASIGNTWAAKLNGETWRFGINPIGKFRFIKEGSGRFGKEFFIDGDDFETAKTNGNQWLASRRE